MKTFILATLVTIFAFGCGSKPEYVSPFPNAVSNINYPAKIKPEDDKFINIAVLPIDINGLWGDEKTSQSILTNSITSELFTRLDKDRYNVVERYDLGKITEEIGKQQIVSLYTTWVEIGKILNVEKIIVGSASNNNSMIYLSLKLIDVETGKTENIADTSYVISFWEEVWKGKGVPDNIAKTYDTTIIAKKLVPYTVNKLSKGM